MISFFLKIENRKLIVLITINFHKICFNLFLHVFYVIFSVAVLVTAAYV